jgi:molybdate transport system ATP-binding protein
VLEVSVKKELEGFSLDVQFISEAKSVALFAPSGSGKSLTLQAIAGLLKPDEGRIKVVDRVFFDSSKRFFLPPQKRRVGYLFQDYALFPHMTVWENVSYGCRDEKRVEEVLKMLEIQDIRNRFPREISGGQKQRVALARALAFEPKVLLLDEPFSALHRSLKLDLYQRLREVLAKFSIPMVLVTHDIDEVFELTDYVVIIEKGKVKQTGVPVEVFFNPIDEKVAKLLGHQSFLSGKVVSVMDGYVKVRLGDRRKQILRVKNFPEDLKEGENVFVSILPFAVALNPLEDSVKISAVVKDIFREKDRTVVILHLGGSVVLHLPFSLSPNFIIEKGRETSFCLSPSCISVFRRYDEEEN